MEVVYAVQQFAVLVYTLSLAAPNMVLHLSLASGFKNKVLFTIEFEVNLLLLKVQI